MCYQSIGCISVCGFTFLPLVSSAGLENCVFVACGHSPLLIAQNKQFSVVFYDNYNMQAWYFLLSLLPLLSYDMVTGFVKRLYVITSSFHVCFVMLTFNSKFNDCGL